MDQLTDRIHNLSDRHIRRIQKLCIRCLSERCMFSCHISVITLFDLCLDLIEVTAFTLCSQFFISSLGTDSGRCCQIYFDIRIRQHTGTDISAIHDHIIFVRKLLLQMQKSCTHLRICTADGCHGTDLRGTDQSVYVFTV